MSTTTVITEQEQVSPVTSTVEQAAIEFRHVSISFGDKQVLRDISFTLRRGEMIVITGASESGKSVLLHLAIGLLRPDSGQIFIEGREIETLEEDELLAIRGGRMGLVFQDETLFTGLSVYDNTAYRLAEHGWSEEDTARAVGEVLRFVGLEDRSRQVSRRIIGRHEEAFRVRARLHRLSFDHAVRRADLGARSSDGNADPRSHSPRS